MKSFITFASAMAVAALAGCNPASNPSNAATGQGKQLVYEVDSVMLERPANAPMALVITASGTVRTSGWSAPELQVDPAHSSGDMTTYRFVAQPPPKNKQVTEAEQPVEAILRIGNVPAATKTIRVVAETNRTDSSLAPDSQEETAPALPSPPTHGQNSP